MTTNHVAGEPLVVPLIGEWDLARADELDALLAPAYDHPIVIVDMTEATYADSTCLGRLVKMRKARLDKGFNASAIVLPSPQLRKLFDLVGFDKMWPICDTVEEARNQLAHAG